jgi:hypothetical protein
MFLGYPIVLGGRQFRKRWDFLLQAGRCTAPQISQLPRSGFVQHGKEIGQ